MKYESSILKRLVDTYGVVGNPRYISEIIKEFIVQGKGRFPELFTYQSDWLAHIDEFGLNPTYTVSYTGQSIYAPNTLERPVKSAILKGNTLVNLSLFKDTALNVKGVREKKCYNKDMIKPNTNYLISYNVVAVSGETVMKIDGMNVNSFPTELGKHKMIVRTISNLTTTFPNNLWITGNSNSIEIDDFLIIEYQDGMENWDIPYFEGMQSVKMPVLTTTNADGTKTNILTVNEDVELGSVGEVEDELNLLTGQLTQRTETRAYQEGDESNTEVITDMTNTRYKLPKEVIKTVDLTIKDHNNQRVDHLKSFNGGTHVCTSSLEGSLVPSVDISVVTDLEETLKVCSLDGNTM